jgi:hypothetical protein
MIIRVHGFGKDYPTESNVDPTSHLILCQNVTVLTESGCVIVLCDHQNKPTTTTSLLDDTAPIDILSMEVKPHAK